MQTEVMRCIEIYTINLFTLEFVVAITFLSGTIGFTAYPSPTRGIAIPGAGRLSRPMVGFFTSGTPKE